MKVSSASCLLVGLTLAANATNRPVADYTISVHVIASTSEGIANVCGKRLYAQIDGQFVVLAGCNDPLPTALGDYKARLVKDQVSGRGDLDRRYALLLPSGAEYTFYVSGVCEKQQTICFGYSVGTPR